MKTSIAGAGLVGSMWACYLGQRGYEVDIYERRPDPRTAKVDGGRSINLALSHRGWKALEGIGLKEAVSEMAIPMRRRVMHSLDGELSYQPYGKEGEAIYSVSRAGLNRLLMSKAEAMPNVRVHFEHRCEDADLETGEVTYHHKDKPVSVKSDLVFGTDGAFSAIRGVMQKTDRFSYSQHYIEHGYKELTIPPTADGGFRLEKEALHIWPRGNFMLIALPNPDGSFTCTLFLAYEGKYSFANLKTLADARQFFEEQFADALALMPNFDNDWDHNPTASLVIIRCYPWSRNGRFLLLGDASHAIVPFYGQGMNSGFEDCSILNEMVDQYQEDWPVIMREFEKKRKPDADAIADLAMRNFVEMRDLTGQPDFLLRKKIESRFFDRHPDKWIPLYSMVTFSHIPYSKALAEGRRQDNIMAEVMDTPNIEEKWDSSEVEEKILNLL